MPCNINILSKGPFTIVNLVQCLIINKKGRGSKCQLHAKYDHYCIMQHHAGNSYGPTIVLNHVASHSVVL